MNLKKYKNIFLDRDGVINSIIQRGDIISSPRSMKEFKLRNDFISFAKNFRDKDLLFFVCTNQPDIKRNLLKLDDLHKMHSLIGEHLNIQEIVYCSHDDDDNCLCRKPKPGMLNSLILKYKLEKKDCIIIGDSVKDILAGKNAEIDTCLLETFYNIDVKCLNKIQRLIQLTV